MSETRDWLTIAETARLKGVTRQAVSQAIKEGRLPAERSNGTYHIRRADAEAWEPRQAPSP